MRTIAAILCIFFAGLIVQPVLYNVPPAQAKVMSCCAKHKGKTQCPMQKHSKGCCDNGNCNPLCSQCPVCGFTALTQTAYTLVHSNFAFVLKEKHFSHNWSLENNYTSRLLRPPQSGLI